MEDKLGTWFGLLSPIFKEDYMIKLGEWIANERSLNKRIYPAKEDVFNAFKLCPLDKLKVVIVGQDPYPSRNTADGIAFSTKQDVTPASLQKLHIAIEDDIYGGFQLNASNDLTYLADQGVLLLNSCLSVEEGKPGSHANMGWERFIKEVIVITSNRDYPICYIFFGKKAQKLNIGINPAYHKIILVEHPAAAAYANRKLEHNNCFSKTNSFLKHFYGDGCAIEW